jgi:hypothetical protein
LWLSSLLLRIVRGSSGQQYTEDIEKADGAYKKLSLYVIRNYYRIRPLSVRDRVLKAIFLQPMRLNRTTSPAMSTSWATEIASSGLDNHCSQEGDVNNFGRGRGKSQYIVKYLGIPLYIPILHSIFFHAILFTSPKEVKLSKSHATRILSSFETSYGDACRKVCLTAFNSAKQIQLQSRYRAFQRNPCEGGVTNFTACTSV